MTGVIAMIFGSAGNAMVDCVPFSMFASRILPDSNPANVGFETRSNGQFYSIENGVKLSVGTWLIAGAASDYEIRVTGTGDDPGNLNTWLNMGSTRTWELTLPGGVADSASFSGTWEIRRASSGVVQDSASLGLTVTIEI